MFESARASSAEGRCRNEACTHACGKFSLRDADATGPALSHSRSRLRSRVLQCRVRRRGVGGRRSLLRLHLDAPALQQREREVHRAREREREEKRRLESSVQEEKRLLESSAEWLDRPMSKKKNKDKHSCLLF